MRKNIFLIIICLLSLVSCKSNADIKNTPMTTPESMATSTIEQGITPVIIPEPTITPALLNENTLWVDAYADFFMQSNYPSYFFLLDVDFDDIPELFLYTSGYGANMWLVSILHFSEDGLEQIDITEEITAQFELYKDKQTGKMRWMMVMDSFRSSFSYYNNEWKWIDFNDFSSISTEFFFKWDFEFAENVDEADEYEELYYYLYENANEMKQVEYEEIEKRRQELFSEYELIEVQELYAHINDFVINGNSAENPANLDRKLIIQFLLQWK